MPRTLWTKPCFGSRHFFIPANWLEKKEEPNIVLQPLMLSLPAKHQRLLQQSTGVHLAKYNFSSVFKKLKFSIWFWFYQINCGFVYLYSVLFNVYALYSVYWALSSLLFTELVQLIVGRSDSELEMQRHGTKRNILTVDPIMSEDELWMRQCEKLSLQTPKLFFFFWKPSCGNWVWILKSVQFGF